MGLYQIILNHDMQEVQSVASDNCLASAGYGPMPRHRAGIDEAEKDVYGFGEKKLEILYDSRTVSSVALPAILALQLLERLPS
jgi:hypothetical protein